MMTDESPAAGAPRQQTHVVASGDTLRRIAKKYYGYTTLYLRIFEANRDILVDPYYSIRPGQKLHIPSAAPSDNQQS